MMRQHHSARLLLVLLVAAGCARGGSSSAERGEEQEGRNAENGQTAATTPQPAPPAPQPELTEVPEVADPAPLGWSKFDAYFQQLLVVHRGIASGELQEGGLKTLSERAEDLAKDGDRQREVNKPIRQGLAAQLGDLDRRSRERLPEIELIEQFRNIVQMTREVVQTSNPEQMHGYIEKIESMMIELENRLIQARHGG